jgi:hypothetical protein
MPNPHLLCTVYTRFRTDIAPERALLRRAAACVSLVAPSEQDVDTVLGSISDLAEDPRNGVRSGEPYRPASAPLPAKASPSVPTRSPTICRANCYGRTTRSRITYSREQATASSRRHC